MDIKATKTVVRFPIDRKKEGLGLSESGWYVDGKQVFLMHLFYHADSLEIRNATYQAANYNRIFNTDLIGCYPDGTVAGRFKCSEDALKYLETQESA